MTPLRFRVYCVRDDVNHKAGELVYEGDDLALIGDQYQGVYDDKEENELYAIMQSTGLTDKNGTKIFEGDIVKGYTDCGWENGEVVFEKYVTDNEANEDILAWCFSCKKRFHALDPQSTWEVIGNIYQNPDLVQ